MKCVFLGSTQNTTSYHVAQLPRQLFYDLVQLYMIDFELFGFQLPEFDDYASYRDAMAFTHPMPTTNSNYGAPALTTPKNNLNIKRKPKRTNY